MQTFLRSSLITLGVLHAQQATALAEELDLHTYEDLLYHFPFRYEDRTQLFPIKTIREDTYVQCKGTLGVLRTCFWGRKKGMTALFSDRTGRISLLWFNQLSWLRRNLQANSVYVLFGKVSRYKNKMTIIHPEMTPLMAHQPPKLQLHPVYPTTAGLTKHHLHSKGMARLVGTLLERSKGRIKENLPPYMLAQYKLISREDALRHVHRPINPALLQQAQRRLKFEELFYLQLRLAQSTVHRVKQPASLVFSSFKLQEAFQKHLPFTLTKAQAKALNEICQNMGSGWQMNRFLQGDVGSGKTIVAFMSMLLPIAQKAQVVLMAPTEILATQHYRTLLNYAAPLGITVGLLVGATPKRQRTELHEKLLDGALQILVGTHALIQEKVAFQCLGLVVIDEKHRFGVSQRGALWEKSQGKAHRLIMSATPIPRTLAMALYGHLDVSLIDEMPAGRLPIKTYHAYERHRLRLFGFIREQLAKGHQVYIVYPRIEQGKDAALKHLMDGYDSICNIFPGVPIGILHGRMSAENKQYEMSRFARGETKIMVCTTVIEVGVDIPNANLIVIENAAHFGLSQLHQLRGRVGRSSLQSYAVLMTKDHLSPDAKARIKTMTETCDGFKIADADLKLRGPGNLDGVEQSGFLALKIVDLTKDALLVRTVTRAVKTLLAGDPDLQAPQHALVVDQLRVLHETKPRWSRIS